ncbi:MAG: copper-binding protein [Pseudomonadota bacterium]
MNRYLKTLPASAATAALAMVLMVGASFARAEASTASKATAQSERVRGEVIRIDAARSRITLRHARIKSINMEAMTMPFKVREANMLDALKPGDKVNFSVAIQDDELVITELRPVKAAK